MSERVRVESVIILLSDGTNLAIEPNSRSIFDGDGFQLTATFAADIYYHEDYQNLFHEEDK